VHAGPGWLVDLRGPVFESWSGESLSVCQGSITVCVYPLGLQTVAATSLAGALTALSRETAQMDVFH